MLCLFLPPTIHEWGFYRPPAAKTVSWIKWLSFMVPDSRFFARPLLPCLLLFLENRSVKNKYLSVVFIYISLMNEVEHLFIHFRVTIVPSELLNHNFCPFSMDCLPFCYRFIGTLDIFKESNLCEGKYEGAFHILRKLAFSLWYELQTFFPQFCKLFWWFLLYRHLRIVYSWINIYSFTASRYFIRHRLPFSMPFIKEFCSSFF